MNDIEQNAEIGNILSTFYVFGRIQSHDKPSPSNGTPMANEVALLLHSNSNFHSNYIPPEQQSWNRHHNQKLYQQHIIK